MGSRSYFSKLLDKVEGHSTVIGKVWITSLFIFRVLALAAGASLVWGDEHALFVCNTQQPGCLNACYDAAFPISLVRFWIMQVLFVSAPTLVHVMFGVYSIHQDKQEREDNQPQKEMLESPGQTEKMASMTLKAPLLHHYLIRICFKIMLELAFVVCQYILIGFVMEPEIKCPCPISVDCFVPRSTEKTIFSIFMVTLACVSLLLSVAEVTYSACTRKERKHLNRQPSSTSAPDS